MVKLGWKLVKAEQSRKAPRVTTAVGLGIVADLAGTLATFMPMKSVFILAADDIPSFFPQILIDAGPAATSVLLILVAGVFAIMSTLARKTVNKIAPPQTPIRSSHFRHKQPIASNSEGLDLAEATSLSLVFVLLAGSAVISGLFTVTVLGWTIGSLAILSIHIHRSVRRPPFATGAAEFAARFSKWVSGSALWSTVGAAIITWLISPPTLGLTGILLAAVLLARFQQTAAKLAPLVYEGRARATHAKDPLLSSKPVSSVTSPAEFFATVAGRRTLNNIFEHLNLDRKTWHLVGQPTNTQLSLVARGTNDARLRIVRVFAHGREDLVDKELQLRQRLDWDLLPGAWQPASATFWGIPTIVLSGETIDESALFATPTQDQLFDLQVSWELDSLLTKEVPQSVGTPDADALAESIQSGLHVAANLPGQHQETTSALLAEIDPLLEILRSAPRALSTGGAISGLNVLQYSPGHFTLLDVSGWKGLPLGWAWPENQKYTDRFETMCNQREMSRRFFESGFAVSRLAGLSRALGAKNFPRLHQIARNLVS